MEHYTKTLPQTLIIESLDEEAGLFEMKRLSKLHLCISDISERACERCKSCQLYEKGNHPDLIFIKKEPDKKNIPINLIRQEILKKINSRPHLSKIICVIIHNAQTLSTGAQNSLLKTLEEPPLYVKIILSVNKASNLLPTIISRSQILTLRGQYIENDINLLKRIAELDVVQRFQLAKEITEMDKKQERKDSQNSLQFIDQLTRNLRSFVKANVNNPKIVKVVIKDIKKTLDARTKISYNVNKRLVIENLLLQSIPREIYKENI